MGQLPYAYMVMWGAPLGIAEGIPTKHVLCMWVLPFMTEWEADTRTDCRDPFSCLSPKQASNTTCVPLIESGNIFKNKSVIFILL